MAYGRDRGMDSVINVSPLEFPPEFAPALNSSQTIHQLGELSIVPGANTAIDDPKLNTMHKARFIAPGGSGRHDEDESKE